jgi:DNA repair ATPase RecN
MTTFYSERRSNQQQLHDARVELRQLIVQIDEVSREITDIEDQYRNNPTALSLARSLAFTRKIILVNQAAEVADEIDEDVSPAEYYAIGSALASLGTTDPRVFKYYNRGLAKGTDPRAPAKSGLMR